MTEKELLDLIRQETGKEIVKDYGFILGTHCPHSDGGNLSADRISGFEVWKRVGNGSESLRITPEQWENKMSLIIDFLKN